jgi:hypothetical protein
MVRGVYQLDQHLVLPGRQPHQVNRIAVTRIRPMPRQVIDGYVQMPDPWRYTERARSEHRDDVYVLHPVLDLDEAAGELIGKRGSTISLGEGSFSIAA